jgi:hypothetical protein
VKSAAASLQPAAYIGVNHQAKTERHGVMTSG